MKSSISKILIVLGVLGVVLGTGAVREAAAHERRLPQYSEVRYIYNYPSYREYNHYRDCDRHDRRHHRHDRYGRYDNHKPGKVQGKLVIVF